ncbi:glycosyltransferase family 1 protein [Pseudomonadota bacterium]
MMKKKIVNNLFQRFGFEIRRFTPALYRDFVSLKAIGPAKGDVLLAYIVDPFLLKEGGLPSSSHTHHMESLLIAEAFRSLGYNVDVIDYRNGVFKPRKNYTFFVSARTHFTRIASQLNHDCIKIAHLDTAHFLFNNAAAYRRLLELQQRRGVTTASLKWIEHNYAPESADYLTVLGNGFTESTYSYSKKQIFRLPVPAPDTCPPCFQKDFSQYKNRFLWLGSSGVVHKGLDLVLDVFSELPDHHLTVCGPLDDPAESEFQRAYHRELYETANIDTVGWVDVSSQKFVDITSKCCALIYPSSSEGQAGAVVTCLQASLIPLVSYESGIDVGDFGIILKGSSHLEIKDVIMKISEKPNAELAEMSRGSYEYAKSNHSKENYRKEFRRVIVEIGTERGLQMQ